MTVERPWRAALAAACLAACVIVSGPAQAQAGYPTQPIRVLVPYAPGGATDFAARLIAQKARDALGQNLIVDNKAGAGGLLALEELVRAKPDGYTLMIGNVSTNAITPVIFKHRMSFDYDTAVLPVARLLVTPSVFMLNAKFPANSWQEFVAYARNNPGKVRATSTGVGSFSHFDLEVLQRRLGIQLIHIPYREGAAGTTQAIINGDADYGGTNAVQGYMLRDSGKVKIIATSMTERIKTLPDVPTFAELGLPGQGTLNWSGLFVPAGTPPEIVKTLHDAFSRAANDPFVVERAAKSATFPFTVKTPEEMAEFVKSELAKWRKIAAEVKIDLN